MANVIMFPLQKEESPYAFVISSKGEGSRMLRWNDVIENLVTIWCERKLSMAVLCSISRSNSQSLHSRVL
jgi:hypothetical protein